MNLLKSLTSIVSITILSRLFGFVRDYVIARIFGAEIEIDAFLVAFKLPNLLRRIFAEGAFTQAFIPVLIEYKNKKNEDSIRIFIAYISGLLILVLTVIIIIGIFTAPWIVIVTAKGFTNNKEKFLLTTQLLRISFPYILLISLTSMAGAILNTWNYFSISSFAPIFLNITIIIFALFVSPYFNPPVLALSWAVIVGGVFQLIYQLPYLKKIGMLVLPKINLYDIGTIRIVKMIWIAILGVAINQISLVINTIFASFLTSGSISWMYYADRLMELPSGILGAALGTVLLPSLSRSFSTENHEEYCQLMDWGLRLCFLLALPSTVILGILANPLIASLFQYGKFTAFDTLMTQHALNGYSVGLIGLIITKVLASGFYSRQNIKTPMKIGIITIITTQIMNIIFIGPMKHAGLSLSIGISGCVNAVLLYWQLRKQKIFLPQPGWIIFLLRLLTAVLIMSLSLVAMLNIVTEWSFGTISYRLFRLITIITVSITVYCIILNMLGFKVREFIRNIPY